MKQRKEDKEKSGIYVIKNNTNNKIYVGKTVNIYRRIKWHVSALNTKDSNENRHLINSWHKYGRDNFTYYVVEYIDCDDRIELDLMLKEKELYWMKELNTLNPNLGYNLRYDSESGMKVSNETREKLRKATLKRYKNKSERIKQSEKMKKLHKERPELYKDSYDKIAYKTRQYRIAKCDKKSGDIIKIYDIIQEILNENPDYYKQAIKGCCQGTKNSYKGFRWHYVDLKEDKLILKGKFANK